MAIINGTPLNDRLNGTAGDDTIFGLEGDDVLIGNDGNDLLGGGAGRDQLFGGNGADVLDGGTGADKMAGGLGNDDYYVDHVGDVAAEGLDGLAGGFDGVFASVTHTLGFGIENLKLTGSAAINGTGNALNNT
ncbi:MAG: hypothetical protein JNL29_12385, partial [Nitrospira sp.]|nr:hypothetical protein [Nitrospira sp.]